MSITRKEIEHLATLARIELGEEESEALAKDISGILGYISVVNEIAAEKAGEKKVGVTHTVLREDGEPHEAGVYSKDLLKEAPMRDRNYIQVKKILGEK